MKKITVSVLFCFIVCFADAQATDGPAGITTGLKAWIKADAGITQDGNGINTWADQSGEGNNFTQGTNNEKPDFVGSYANYNPAVQFDGDRHNMETATGLITATSTDLNVFVVGRNNSGGDGWPVFILGQTNGINWDNGGYGITASNSGANITGWVDEWDRNVVSTPWQDEPQAIIEGSYDGSNVRLFFNSELEGSDNYTNNVGDGGMNTYLGGENTSYNLNGFISEVIVYDDNITYANKQKINTYLAIKYGITLSGNTNSASGSFEAPNGDGIQEGDYVRGDGTVIWDASAATVTYHNNIVGVGKNTASELDQRKSKSENNGAALILDNNGAFGSDGDFLVAGSNELSGTNTTNLPTGYTSISSRVWRTEETGSTSGTIVRLILTDMGITNLGSASDYALMMDPTNADFSAGAIAHTTGASLSGDTLTFTGVNLGDGYMALASNIQTIFYATQDGKWDAIRWSLTGRLGGDADPGLPGTADNVVIDGWDVVLDHNNVQIANISLTNAGNDNGKLFIQTGDNLIVTGDFSVQAKNKNKNIELKVKNASTLVVGGNLTMEFDAAYVRNKNVKIKLENTAAASVNGVFTINMNNNGGINKKHIELKDNSVFTCQSAVINQSGGTGDNILWIEDAATWNVSNDLTINQTGGDVLQLLLNSGAAGSTAKLNVGGDFLINKDGGNDVEIILDQADSEITVGGNLTLDNAETGAGDLLYLQLDNGSDLDVEGNITYTAAAQSNTYVEVNNASKLEIAGNITRSNNFGILDFNATSTIVFNGVSNTQIFPADGKTGGGSDYFDYQNVLLNNTFGTAPQITMEGTATVHGSIIFTDGIVSSSSSELLIIDDGATSTAGSTQSYVDGPIRKIGDAVFVFPVGDDGVWARLGMEDLANYNLTTEFTCQYFRSPAVFPAAMALGVDHVSTIEYWDLTRTNDADAACNISLFWEDESTSGITDMADLALCHYSSLTGEWEDQGGTGNDLGVNGSIASTTPLTSFSPIAFGSRGGANVLPVELVSFEANLNIDKVELHWVTATEESNELFTIERSQDGITFEEILWVEGAGGSSNRIEYFDIDYEPHIGVSYYRLKQTDTDGKFTYSAKVLVDYLGTNLLGQVGTDIKIWPNPNEGTHLNIQMNGYEPENEVRFVVTDIVGREYYSKVLLTDIGGHITNAIDLDNALPVGIYVITGSDQNHLYSSKFIVK
ncbi:MAG: T9SS type A sorting domain-containing protein [Flavobacteriales bacterium]|nr:T9SS type A sorting domain-containing protein [Flavobacteriales bacterium]